MSDIPVLETARLRLRGHTRADFEALAAMWADPEVTRHIGAKPSTREDSWARLLRYGGHWALMGYGFWLVEEKESRAFVGDVGFFEGQREIEPSMVGKPEHGWALASWAQGRGYATEAVLCSLAWARVNLAGREAMCMIAPDNTPSIRVAEKAGYVELAHTHYRGERAILYRQGL